MSLNFSISKIGARIVASKMLHMFPTNLRARTLLAMNLLDSCRGYSTLIKQICTIKPIFPLFKVLVIT